MFRKLLIISCLLGTTLYVSAKKQDKKHKKAATEQTTATDVKPDYKVIGASMPPIHVVTSKGRHIYNKDVENDANLMVMLFNPTCSHCEDETVLLQQNIGIFHKSKLLMVAASAMQPYLDGFEKSYHIDQYPTMQVGLDSLNLIEQTFTYQSLPQINIYDKHRKLIKIFAGETPIDSLKAFIQ